MQQISSTEPFFRIEFGQVGAKLSTFLDIQGNSGLPPCSEFYFCSRSLSVLAVSIYFPTLSLKKPQSAKFRAALRIYDLGAKYFRALSDRNDLEFFFEI